MTDAQTEDAKPELAPELKNYDYSMAKRVWDDDGKMFELPPLTRKKYPPDIANRFLMQHPRWVRPFEEIPLPIVEGDSIAWVANVTGSCLLPENIVRERKINGVDVQEKIGNPLRVKQVIKHHYAAPDKISGPDDDRRRVMSPKRFVEMEPLTRYPLPKSLADTFLSRDARQAAEMQGKLVRCPPPSECEPNITWDLEDIHLYAFILSKELFSPTRLEQEFPLGKEHDDSVKQGLLDEIFPLLIDDKFSKPSLQAFEAIRSQARNQE